MNSGPINHPIYLLFTHNTNAEQSSMRPIGVSTNFGAFCTMIASCVFNGSMEYRGKKRLEGFRLFHRDYRKNNLQFSSLKNGHVKQMRDGMLLSVPQNGIE